MSDPINYSAAVNELGRMKNRYRALEKIEDVLRAAAQAQGDLAKWKAEAEKIQAEVGELQSTKEAAEKYIADHEAVLANLRAEEERLRAGFEEERRKEIADHKARIKELRKSEEAAQDELEEAQAQLRELRASLPAA